MPGSWLSFFAAAVEAVTDAQNEYGNAARLHRRYSPTLRTVRDFHSFWIRVKYYASDAEKVIVKIDDSAEFHSVCTGRPDSLIGLMYNAIVQANNNNKSGFVKKSREVVARLDSLIGLSTQRCGAYQLMRQKWVQFHNAEVKRLK